MSAFLTNSMTVQTVGKWQFLPPALASANLRHRESQARFLSSRVCSSLKTNSWMNGGLRLHNQVKDEQCSTYGTFRRSRKDPNVVAMVASAVDTPTAVFPSFFPPEVEQLEEEAAKNMARRVQRLPVQTRMSAKPIMTGCVVPTAAGKAQVPILLLHSFDSACLEWRRLYPLLEEAGAEAWALDILGWGFTDARLESGACSVAAKREHIYEFWRQHIGRPVAVVGPSLGGAAAIDFALAHPEAVAQLVLIDAQGFAEGVGPMASLPRPLAYAGVAVLKSILLRSYAQKLAYQDTTLATTDAMRVGRLHTLLPGWEDAMVAFMQSGGYNVAAYVKEVKQDVLLIWGEDDKILDKKFAERFAEELTSVKLEWIAECGHLPHLEKPQKVLDLLMDFVPQ